MPVKYHKKMSNMDREIELKAILRGEKRMCVFEREAIFWLLNSVSISYSFSQNISQALKIPLAKLLTG